MDDTHEASRFIASMIRRVGPQRFEVWFGGPARLSISPAQVQVLTSSPLLVDWIRQQFRQHLLDAGCEVFGRPVPVAFDICQVPPGDPGPETQPAPGPSRGAARNGTTGIRGDRVTDRTSSQLITSPPSQAARPSAAPPAALPPAAGSPASRQGAAKPQKDPDEGCSFHNFCVGPSNEYAYRASRLLADGLQQASPLLLSGPTGVGKTHLLRAIRTAFRRGRPRSRVLYLTSEQFTSGFVAAVRGSGMPSFRQKCRGADLLLLDDIHFLAGKRATLEELQYTLDAMAGDGRRVALASDRGLADLQQLGAELVSRFAGGLTCEMRRPELATRREIVRRLASRLELECDEQVMQLVATQISGGARELRGALHRLQLTATTAGTPITLESARDALADLSRQTTRPVRLADIQKVVCDAFGIETATLSGQRKGRAASQPRMLAMWLARKHTRAPWSEIGHFFGRRSHSTVISAHHRVEDLLRREASLPVADSDCRVEDVVRQLEDALRTA